MVLKHVDLLFFSFMDVFQFMEVNVVTWDYFLKMLIQYFIIWMKRNMHYIFCFCMVALVIIFTLAGEKPFVCEECGKSFTCKSELNRHSQRHSSERPYTCSDCGQSFKMRHNLNKHQKAHTGTQQWKCLLCSAVFSKPKLLEVSCV